MNEASRHRSRPRSSPDHRRGLHRDNTDNESQQFDLLVQRVVAMIEQEFNAHVRRSKQSYTYENVSTESDAERHMIEMQHIAISTLRYALLHDHNFSSVDLQDVLAAQDDSRVHSFNVFRHQCDRIIQDSMRRPRLPSQSLNRQLELPTRNKQQGRSFTGLQRSSRFVYCRYAADLQRNPERALIFPRSGSSEQDCPACHVQLCVTAQDVWLFTSQGSVLTTSREGADKEKWFSINARLVVKSHTPRAELMCVICFNERLTVCLCASVDALIQHIVQAHTFEELMRESDTTLQPERR